MVSHKGSVMNEEEKQNQSSDAHVSSLERSGTPDQTTSQTADIAPDKPRRRGPVSYTHLTLPTNREV